MTKSYINSNPTNYDRRSALKGAVAVPFAAIPFLPNISEASEGPVISDYQPWLKDDVQSEVLTALIETADTSELSLDFLVKITKKLRADVVLHLCSKIIEREQAKPKDESVLACQKLEGSDEMRADALEALMPYEDQLPAYCIRPVSRHSFNTAIDIDIYVNQMNWLEFKDKGSPEQARKWKADLQSARLKQEGAASKLGVLHLARAHRDAMDRNSMSFLALLECKPTSRKGMALKLDALRDYPLIDSYMDTFVKQLADMEGWA